MKKHIIILFVIVFIQFAQSLNAAGWITGAGDDIELLKFINLKRNHSLDGSFKFISVTSPYVYVIVPVSLFTAALIKKNQLNKRKAIVIAGTLCVSEIISTSMKYTFNRTRPYVTYPVLDNLVLPNGPSFPSGHTSEAFAFSTSLSMAYPKWYIVAPSFLWAASVGYSRMHLGVHYPSDVLGGAIIGAGSAYLSSRFNKWLDKKQARKIATQ